MTLPNGPDGVDQTNGFYLVSAEGYGDQSIADLVGNDLATVQDAYKNRYVLNGGSVFTDPGGPLAAVWDGLRTGISLPLSIIEAIVNRLFGTNIEFSDMGSVLDAIQIIPGVTEIITLIKNLTGVDLNTIFDGIDITNPGAILAAITSAVQGVITGALQHVIDAIVGGLTGGATTGNDPASIGLALINQLLGVPVGLFDQVFGLLAALTGQVTAIQNNPGGATQTDDFTTGTLVAWTNVLNSLALVTGLIRTTTIAAGYIGTVGTPRKPNTDRHGVQIVVDGKMRGAVRAWLCGDATMSNYAAVEIFTGFDGDAARIVTGSSPSLTVVQKQTDFIDAAALGPTSPGAVSARVQPLTAFDIRYDPTPNTFTVLRNGSVVTQWVDTTNIVSHGSGKRLVGVVANAFGDAAAGANGYGIKKVTFYDW